MYKNIKLFTLQTFADTGGIQKMSRTLAHSLYTICSKKQWDFKLISLYDRDKHLLQQYLPKANFKGFGQRKVSFLLRNVFTTQKPDVVVLSHINLALVGLLIKLFSPKTRVWLIAHGIEVWRPLSFNQRKILKQCDKVICVSSFTQQQMQKWHQLPPEKCTVLNNALDPFLQLPVDFKKPEHLQKKYGLKPTDKIILSLTRLASFEQYKGHDQVLKAVSQLKKQHQDIKYILAGKYDLVEGERIRKLIAGYGIEQQVILTGFIEENELPELFLLADTFVLPSKKEGFGIVFIEALAYGLPVICGNADGSLDAIRNGELGKAIDPDDIDALEKSIAESLSEPVTVERRKHLQQKCLQYFSEQNYISTLQKMLTDD